MPQKQCTVPLQSHYSSVLKHHVIYQAFTLHKSSIETAIDLDMPVWVIQRIKQTWLEIGDVCQNRQFIGRPCLLSPIETRVSSCFVIISSKMGKCHAVALQVIYSMIQFLVHASIDRALARYLSQWDPRAASGATWHPSLNRHHLGNTQMARYVFKEGKISIFFPHPAHPFGSLFYPAFLSCFRAVWREKTRVCAWGRKYTSWIYCCSWWSSCKHSNNILLKWLGC